MLSIEAAMEIMFVLQPVFKKKFVKKVASLTVCEAPTKIRPLSYKDSQVALVFYIYSEDRRLSEDLPRRKNPLWLTYKSRIS